MKKHLNNIIKAIKSSDMSDDAKEKFIIKSKIMYMIGTEEYNSDCLYSSIIIVKDLVENRVIGKKEIFNIFEDQEIAKEALIFICITHNFNIRTHISEYEDKVKECMNENVINSFILEQIFKIKNYQFLKQSRKVSIYGGIRSNDVSIYRHHQKIFNLVKGNPKVDVNLLNLYQETYNKIKPYN